MSEITESLSTAHKKRDAAVRMSKFIFLGMASAGLITLTWWLLNLAIYGHKPLVFWFWVMGSALLWCTFVSFFILINPYRLSFALVNVVGLVAYLAIMPKDLYVAIGGVIFFLLGIIFQKRMVLEEKNQQHFSIRRTVSSSILIATYGFMFVIGFNVYYFVNKDFKNDPDKFYDRIGVATSRSIPRVSENFTGIDLNQSLDQYLTEKAESSLPEELKSAPSSTQDEYVQQYRQQFLEQFGIQDSKQTLGSALAIIINQKGREIMEPYQKFFPLIFALVIFALLRTFAFIFNWLTIFVSWAIFRILYMMNFFKLTKAVVEVDKLDI